MSDAIDDLESGRIGIVMSDDEVGVRLKEIIVEQDSKSLYDLFPHSLVSLCKTSYGGGDAIPTPPSASQIMIYDGTSRAVSPNLVPPFLCNITELKQIWPNKHLFHQISRGQG